MAIYVVSDIHGAYEKYIALLKEIKFSCNDVLYVLGDVIDRGSEPIRLLTDIMERENVQMLLGNHELMMYDAVTHETWRKHRIWMDNGGAVTEKQFYEQVEWNRNNIIDYIFICQ